MATGIKDEVATWGAGDPRSGERGEAPPAVKAALGDRAIGRPQDVAAISVPGPR